MTPEGSSVLTPAALFSIVFNCISKNQFLNPSPLLFPEIAVKPESAILFNSKENLFSLYVTAIGFSEELAHAVKTNKTMITITAFIMLSNLLNDEIGRAHV